MAGGDVHLPPRGYHGVLWSDKVDSPQIYNANQHAPLVRDNHERNERGMYITDGKGGGEFRERGKPSARVRVQYRIYFDFEKVSFDW